MLFPNSDRAVIDPVKLHGYLLSKTHLPGRYKARFLMALGFAADRWRALELALRDQHLTRDAEFRGTGPYGQLFTIQADLTGPEASAPFVSVWVVRGSDDVPHFVTVYPAGTQ